jgi:acetoin utilization deacetylase AcuC-like enzyme
VLHFCPLAYYDITGFCCFSNVSLAAVHAIEKCGARRVAILDWDVHHGGYAACIIVFPNQELATMLVTPPQAMALSNTSTVMTVFYSCPYTKCDESTCVLTQSLHHAAHAHIIELSINYCVDTMPCLAS